MKVDRRKPKSPLDHEPLAVTRARDRAGLTRAQLAAAIGISPGLMSEIEKGTRNATPARIREIARACNCPVAALERGHWQPTTLALMNSRQLDIARETLFAQTQSAIDEAREAAERERGTFMDLYQKVRPLMTDGLTVADALIRLARDGVAA